MSVPAREPLIADGGERLDQWLARKLPRYSRMHLKGLIGRGCVTVNGAARKPGYLLKAGDKVEVVHPGAPAEPGPGLSLNDWIIHEDKHLLVLNKPAGLLIHPLGMSWLTAPGAALADEPNLAALLLTQRAAMAAALPRCGIVHRLDRPTSGVLLVAKTIQAQERLQAGFKDRQVDKIYRAVVRGVPSSRKARVDAPIGRKPGHRKIMVTPFGRPSETGIRIVDSCASASLVEAMPLTGRTHQIRAHLALLGHPVMGDPEHDDSRAVPWPPRLMLHAYRIEFAHPATGKPCAFKAEPPRDFRDFWKLCRKA